MKGRGEDRRGLSVKTTLPEDWLIGLRQEGNRQARVESGTPDLFTPEQAKRILRIRGEDWAASVLGRPDLSQIRHSADVTQAHLDTAERWTLIMADAAEWEHMFGWS